MESALSVYQLFMATDLLIPSMAHAAKVSPKMIPVWPGATGSTSQTWTMTLSSHA